MYRSGEGRDGSHSGRGVGTWVTEALRASVTSTEAIRSDGRYFEASASCCADRAPLNWRTPWTVIRLRASFSEPMGDIITGRKEVDDMSSLLTLAGVYRDGKVEFAKRPAGVGEDVPVLVTFLPANQGSES